MIKDILSNLKTYFKKNCDKDSEWLFKVAADGCKPIPCHTPVW